MAEINRNTVLAIVPEVTEGTPVSPTGATQYVAVQEDLTLNPNYSNLDNKELAGSIGKAKQIVGIEHPDANMSHYLRHSGVEGTAPDFSPLLKAAFGTQNSNGTQRATTAASSVSVVKLAAGGTDFIRGRAIMVKDGTNGYSIRPVLSVSTNDLTLGFNLANAPATGVNVGKCVSFEPANSGHPTLSLWAYRGNRSNIEMIAGARVTQANIHFKAGDLVNAQFRLAGTGYYYNPIEITASTKYLDFLDNAATRAAVVTPKVYKDPTELADAIASAMNGLGSANTFTCVYSSATGKFTITSTGSTLTLKWNTGSNTANSIASKIGFSTGADSSGALTYASPTAQSWVSPYTPTFDSADPLAAKDNEVFIGSATDNTSMSVESCDITIADGRKELLDVSVASGISGSILDQRDVTVKLVAYVAQHDVAKYSQFRQGTSVAFAYNFGTKSGGNWVAGKCGCLYIPTAVISSFKESSNGGILVFEIELKAYVDSSGNGEVYLNFL